MSKKRILCVDDDRNALKALQRILRNRPHETYVVDSGDRALQMVEEIRPDLIVLDLWSSIPTRTAPSSSICSHSSWSPRAG